MTIPNLKNVPCRKDRGGCGEILAQTDGEFLILSGLKLNEEYATQQITCTCGKRTIWRCEPQYLERKKRR